VNRVLYIGAPFFTYHRDIAAEFEAKGWAVDHFNDRPSDNSFEKAVLKVRPSLLEGRVRTYFREIIAGTAALRYDLVLIVNGKTLSRTDLEKLRLVHPDAHFVLYLWDSVRLYPHVVDFFDLMDRVYSFDPADCFDHPVVSLLPLFYNRSFGAVGEGAAPVPDYDLVSVCTAHPNRYATMSVLFPELERRGVNLFSYPYLNPLQYAYNRVRVAEFRHARSREFRFAPLDPDAYIDVLRRSRGVYDMNHSAQTGLTMRTIETLGARRQLVTSNATVERYRFFEPSRVLVVDPTAPDADAIVDFMRAPAERLDEEQYRLYSIDSWVEEIITGRHHHDVALYLR
jgi:hypothetical protein